MLTQILKHVHSFALIVYRDSLLAQCVFKITELWCLSYEGLADGRSCAIANKQVMVISNQCSTLASD
jgi:hypothetical protein